VLLVLGRVAAANARDAARFQRYASLQHKACAVVFGRDPWCTRGRPPF
jgi:hypothetical protein